MDLTHFKVLIFGIFGWFCLSISLFDITQFEQFLMASIGLISLSYSLYKKIKNGK